MSGIDASSNNDRRAGCRRFITAAMLAMSFCLSGCTDGPLFQLKRLSPWHQREWSKDRALGPTFSQRLGELKLVDSQIASMSPSEQQLWAERLEKLVTDDTSSEMRAQAALVLAKIDSEATIRALNKASTDKEEKVRLTACRAWTTRGGDQARDMLMSLARTDESDDVRQAALAGLAKFKSPEVREMLVESLDSKNPAVQQQAVVALREMTGRDYGGDFDSWKRYLGGEDVPEPEPRPLTARIMDSLPWTK